MIGDRTLYFHRLISDWLIRFGANLSEIGIALSLRRKRQRLLLRALLAGVRLKPARQNYTKRSSQDILIFSTLRNERKRLPYFFEHYRKLGATHFLFVDNNSDDGSLDYILSQSDASVWTTDKSYKAARFGVDWLTYLQIRFGNGKWCLTTDVDELLIYPHHETRPLPALTGWLDQCGEHAFAAMMLDLYPKGSLADQSYQAQQNPLDVLNWFDAGNLTIQIQRPMKNLWIQGGPRSRIFFHDDPRRGPTLNKIPLVKWHWRYAYVNSTHSILPRNLNNTFSKHAGETTSGVLLHTKFLDVIIEKSAEELQRKQHFRESESYADYHHSLTKNPDLWCAESTYFESWKQLEELGLISTGGWS